MKKPKNNGVFCKKDEENKTTTSLPWCFNCDIKTKQTAICQSSNDE